MKHNAPKKYFIQEHLQRGQIYHGGIGNKNIEEILLKEGFQPILFPYHFNFSIKAKISRIIFSFKCFWDTPSSSIVFFQWPLYAKAHMLLLRLFLTFRRSVKVVCFITDINGLKDGDKKVLKEEVHLFKKIGHFVVHNSSMEKWLLTFHPTATISAIEFFDFLPATQSDVQMKPLSPSIAFAGFLDKSKFIYDLYKIKNVDFHLYGELTHPIPLRYSNLNYYGVFKPADLFQNIKGSFGLVWDGDSIEDLSGVFGEYNKYISPNKLSLYITKGLPVIAHPHAASAQIISKYKIGFTVSSLFNIEEKISQLSENEYEAMKKNCLLLADKISNGRCLSEALYNLGIY